MLPRETIRTEVRILDAVRNAARVRVDAGLWIDYLHLARTVPGVADRERPLGAGGRPTGRTVREPRVEDLGGHRYAVTRRVGGYREALPPARLARYVSRVWCYDRPLGAPPIPDPGHRVLPDTLVGLCWECVRDARGAVRAGQVTFMGPIRTPRWFAPVEDYRMVAIQLKPEWATPVLGIAPGEHVDAWVPLRALWMRGSVDGLESALARTATPTQALEVMLRALGRRLEDARRTRDSDLAHAALERIRSPGPRPTTIEAVSAALGVSPRHLRRVVGSATGQSPKSHHRIWRFSRIVARADRSDLVPDWSRLAMAHGYFDQAHLIRDYRLLAGLAPTASYRERRGQRLPETSAGRSSPSTPPAATAGE